MDTILWILQALMAFTFLYSGICKSILSEKELVARGQMGVEGLPISLTRFIGIAEILGAIGLILPWWLNIVPLLTPVAAICFALIMIPAARIHYKRREYRNISVNAVLFTICMFIAYSRF